MSTDPTLVEPTPASENVAPSPAADPATTAPTAELPAERVLFIYGCRTCPVELAVRGRYAGLNDPSGAVAGAAIPDADLTAIGHPDLRMLASRTSCPICGLPLYEKRREVFLSADPEPTEENPTPEPAISAPAGEVVPADQVPPTATGDVAAMQQQAADQQAAAAETPAAPAEPAPAPADTTATTDPNAPASTDATTATDATVTPAPAEPVNPTPVAEPAPADPNAPATDPNAPASGNEPSGWSL